jgi:hypothetical protein
MLIRSIFPQKVRADLHRLLRGTEYAAPDGTWIFLWGGCYNDAAPTALK